MQHIKTKGFQVVSLQEEQKTYLCVGPQSALDAKGSSNVKYVARNFHALNFGENSFKQLDMRVRN